jgi:hypothetical protein
MMNMKPGLKPLGEMIAAAALAALAALAAPALAQTQAQTTSVAQADATLAQVDRDREAVNDEFAASERVCNNKFFVNNCLDKAKEKRRVALTGLRAIEVEAQHFKRADSVAKRDSDLAERARKDAEEQAARAAQPPKQHHVADEKPHTPPSGPRVAEREATHEAKLKREAAQEAAEAGKRAANVEAFEKKKAESVRRQAEVARKKEENAAKAAAKEAADKKKADAEAAAAARAASK